MGTLRVKKIDFNDGKKVSELKEIIQKILHDRNSYYILSKEDLPTFHTIDRIPPKKKGWYIILNDGISLYSGQANDLDNRINKQADSSYDSKRSSDDKRNFIQKFIGKDVIKKPYVCVITEEKLRKKLRFRVLPDLDFNSIEKIIDIFRSEFKYLSYEEVPQTKPMF